MTNHSMSRAGCVLQSFAVMLLVNTILLVYRLTFPAAPGFLLINSTHPPAVPYLPLSLISNPPPPLLFAVALESSCARAL